jgi:hypothetical protein
MAGVIQNGRQISMRQYFCSSEYFSVLSFAFGLRFRKEQFMEEHFLISTEDGATNLRWHLKVVFLREVCIRSTYISWGKNGLF